MIKLVMLFRYKAFRYIALLSATCLLSGCLGGTVAQQIARSIATSVVDKTMARAMDVDEDQAQSNRDPFNVARQEDLAAPSAMLPGTAINSKPPQTKKSENVEVDDVTYAMATFSFKPLEPIAEPLPEEVAEVETRVDIMQGNQLVHVELFNLLIGEEKNAVYENARLVGSTSLPPKREWQNWQVGVGAIEHSKKMVTFLIPPEFGKLPSGTMTMVELAGPGELNIARYEPNNLRYRPASGFKQATGLKQTLESTGLGLQ
jgi:hypothetical protein